MSTLESAWQSLGEDADALALVRSRAAEVPLDAVLPVGALVHDAIAAASLSASLLAARRGRAAAGAVELDPDRIATAVTSEKHYRQRGEPMSPWAELSGFWPTGDGWVRTHANYPHHRDRLLAALGLPLGTTADDLLAGLRGWRAADVEERAAEHGAVAVAVRTGEQWREHPQSLAAAQQPLVALERIADAPARVPRERFRVLDLTRVIAGPVATRTLALWGADVLRVDPPGLAEPEYQHLDTGAGKRSAVLDASAPEFGRLLESADVVVAGYRPGSLDRFGLSPEAIADRNPGAVIARVSAWGGIGPWGARRGFDSIVQAATGIAVLESPDGSRPGALPAQALDHSAGYLLAAAVTTALRRRADEGGSWLADVSLARMAAELMAASRDRRHRHVGFAPTVVELGELVLAAPAAGFAGSARQWSAPPVPLGSSAPEWR
ncbi:CoA transferase [Salinibacterium soli]|uniref:CoA transferase n=1 Tax=Antiquaquibacter soli TaxID=3064523 RepID=A0ABT9BM83_9MICO|nr:CoA transferase [Protaetiibacter sp. WY-16]MDO7882139.1 CoA transferase [Protaetiibacter sp. WY-16]